MSDVQLNYEDSAALGASSVLAFSWVWKGNDFVLVCLRLLLGFFLSGMSSWKFGWQAIIREDIYHYYVEF